MKVSIKPRERILAAIARAQVDRPPICPNIINWIRGRYGCTCAMHQLKVQEEYGFDPLIVYGAYYNNDSISSDYVYRPDANTDGNICYGGYRDLPNVNVNIRVENLKDRTVHIRKFETPDGLLTDRITWARPDMGYGDGPNPHREEPLIKSMADIPALKHLYPQPRKAFVDDLRMFTEIVGDRGLVEYLDGTNAGCWGMESLGPENKLVCAVQDKELLKAVVGICQDQHLRNLKTVLESGHKHVLVSWFQSGPSVGWSPANIEEFFLPLVREGLELVHSYGGIYRFQDDGKMADLIPPLVKMGVDIIGALQPPPVGDCVLPDLKKQYGDKVCLLGGLDPIYTFELGTPETVRIAVTKLLEQIGDGRGVIFCTGEAFGPKTPAECLREWVKTVCEYWQ